MPLLVGIFQQINPLNRRVCPIGTGSKILERWKILIVSEILKHRITSLERWGFRERTPYTTDQLRKIKDSGYNGVYVNGGSGFGPDSISPEMFIKSEIIPDLMPQCIEKHEELIRLRIKDTTDVGLNPWLMWWGIPGPDESFGTGNSVGTNYLDKLLKSEMHNLLKKEPDLFGSRDPKSCNWRGSRPLCLSHPKVKLFYKDIVKKLCLEYPEIEGITFFPGDHNPDMCDHKCERCYQYSSQWQIYVEHLNGLAEIFKELRPNIKLYSILWHSTADARHWILEKLSSKIGVIITANDIIYQDCRPNIDKPFWSTPAEIIDRRTPKMEMVFEQPWMNIAQIGDIARENIKTAQAAGREVLAMHEFSQAEVYDPVINFPLPGKTLKMLKNLQQYSGITGFMDFWGNYGPIEYHTNHAAMRTYFSCADESFDALLSKTAVDITNVQDKDDKFNKSVVEIWNKIEDAVDNQAYFTWFQRFSPAIGRVGARGHFYQPLIPNFINLDNRPAALFVQCAKSWLADDLLQIFANCQFEDMQILTSLAEDSELLAEQFKTVENQRAFNFISGQALSLKLYASLLGSIGRMLSAIYYYDKRRIDELKDYINDEIDAKQKQIEISKQIGYGINIEIVTEDIKLMEKYLRSPDFPDTPLENFTITPTIYVN